MSRPPPARPSGRPPSGSPAKRFRGEIETALTDGARLEDLTLRLTLRDTSLITRDRDIPIKDISFTGGVMRFLGVKVEKGGVTTSALERPSK